MIHKPLLLLLFSLSSLSLLIVSSAQEKKHFHRRCPPFQCGNFGLIGFPFKNSADTRCGFYTVDCKEQNNMKIQLKKGGHLYKVEWISQSDNNVSQPNTVTIKPDTALKDYLVRPEKKCESMESFSLPMPSAVARVTANNSLSVLNCSHSEYISDKDLQQHTKCGDFDIFLKNRSNINFQNFTPKCSCIQIPDQDRVGILITLQVHVIRDCFHCHYKGGQCLTNYENKFYCSNEGNILRLGLGIGIGVLICLVIGFILRRRYIKKRKLSRNISDQYNNSDPEAGSVYYGIPLFSYKDLEEATNNFDSEKELGDGGFGTVYHGVLKDGREVAVKRLYEHNYKRVEQFMNEIEILTRLRHQHLVTLYGCTSRRCRELLLVYEYIPNGTVADHLHGDRAQASPLTWPTRMSIAIETATALAYLHASVTVHRDVKTNNILLDNNFCVKVADFGLSRLFPSDVTHVSTAPQGTPGYVDPEYHQCYQLTSKSDVYSFGVVMMELVSSMPAVDISRHRDEINLSNLAMGKIRKRAYEELVDPWLGFNTDSEIRKAIIAVAELAFQCLQQDKEMRPTMDQVLEELKRIGGGGDDIINEGGVRPPPSPECDEACLLKNVKEQPPSPNAVTENWPSSRSITPNISV